ncbi:hypothetical protein Rhopal_001947-T1 [Rhodotorula paludigena]|uniref:Extracellular membrane protein CFEM domain-containing protein n=1 Tax=Rhodotorula paludigena TaxID=86838 RepID=A0AAV5GHI8_9BASI|nr:hypothetical protein Rhopal_001947-T1 [Rhodotorula paludigena]
MVRTAAAVLALAAAATLASAHSLGDLLKRQSAIPEEAMQQVEGLQSIAGNVISDLSSGNVTSDCSSWIQTLQGCSASAGGDVEQTATCTCGDDAVSQLTACAGAYGSDAESQASGFADFCTNTLPSLNLNGTSASSIIAGATSSLESASSSVASETAASTGSESPSQTTGSANPSETAAPGNSAGKTAAAGGLASVAALVAVLAF